MVECEGQLESDFYVGCRTVVVFWFGSSLLMNPDIEIAEFGEMMMLLFSEDFTIPSLKLFFTSSFFLNVMPLNAKYHGVNNSAF